MWKEMARQMWEVLLLADFDDTCKPAAQGGVCPCASDLDGSGSNRNTSAANSCTRVQTGVACGGVSRVWLRILFHDCGTYDKNAKKGGCNGSIQFELNRAENPFIPTLQFYTQLYKDFRNSTLFPKPFPKPPGMADIVVLGAFLGLSKCQGAPVLRFQPGRVDATTFDAANLLPGRADGFASVNSKMTRASLTAEEIVAAIGAGHTMAALDGERLDKTPSVWDNEWAKGLMATTAALKNPVTLPADASLLTNTGTKSWVQKFANDQNVFRSSVIKALDKLSWLGQIRPPAPIPNAGH